MILARALCCAIAFLTRIPVPAGVFAPRVLGLSVAFFPAVGLLLGAMTALAAWLLRVPLGLPPHLGWALLLVALQAYVTGALHLDGLADVADGLGGGRGDRGRALEIMKDPRVGAFGVVALVFLVFAKVVMMDEVLRMAEPRAVLLAYPLVARFAVVLLVVFYPCARPEGLARTFHDQSGWASAVVAAVVTAGAMWLLGARVWVPAAIGVGVGLAVGTWIAVRLKGLTGDGYGAAVELAELGFLAAAAYPRLRGG